MAVREALNFEGQDMYAEAHAALSMDVGIDVDSKRIRQRALIFAILAVADALHAGNQKLADIADKI